MQDALEALVRIQKRMEEDDDVGIDELRPALRRAAALLCRSDVENRTLVHLLIKVPCIPFTRDSIKLGVSLWIGVLRENSRLETQILVEVMINWEAGVARTNQVPQPGNT